VEVLPEHIVDELTAGSTTQVTFALRNIGHPVPSGLPDGCASVREAGDPAELTLGKERVGSVRVQITVPADTVRP
jgi:hypothetical protein